jgi:flagellar biosynthesis GTPase FlhF
MPAVGWPKWTPPAPILQTTTEPQAVGVKVSSVEADVARVAHKSKPKVKEELKAPPNDLPQLDEPFGPVGGVTLPKGFVQPITISLDHVTTQTWATVSRLLAMIEATKDGGKKLREAREKAEADRQEQERRERAERERVEKEAKEEEERKRKEIEEFEAAEVDKMNKRARRSAVVKPKEVPAMVVEEPRLPEEKAAEETVEPPVKERTLKERIFQALVSRPSSALSNRLNE